MRDAIACQPAAEVLRAWLGLVNGELNFTSYQQHLAAASRLTYLTIDTTGACDLSCPGMCYYHPDIDLRRRQVPEEALQRAIVEASCGLSLQNLVFAGKEPFLNFRLLFSLVRFASAIPERSFAIGIVTNGRHIQRHWELLAELAEQGSLNFIDISIDSGIASQHDGIRGRAGTFDLSSAALVRGSREWKTVRLGASSVLRHDNAEGILELYRRLAPHCRNFFVTPIQPPPFTSTPPLSWGDIRSFLSHLVDLLQTELENVGLEIMVSLLGIYLEDAVAAGFFAWSDLQEDLQGQCFAILNLSGNRLILHGMVLPETGSRIARITFTGAYLPNSHFLQVPEPERYAVGFVQDESILDLHRRATNSSSLLGRILSSRSVHDCRMRSCWNSCFGGLTVAENSVFDGSRLTAQPRLCLKPREAGK